MADRTAGSASLPRGPQLAEFIRAQAVEQGVRDRLGALDKGLVLKVLLIVLPIATWLVSVAGGLYTVYASSDCAGSQFKTYSKTFLYTSYAYACVNLLINVGINQGIRSLIRYPRLAFCTYCAQAGVIGAFLVAMVVLLILIRKTACSSVKTKIENRLF